MKYELPNDLKLHHFDCNKVPNLATYRVCKRTCPTRYRECWERRLRQDLVLDCAIDNERKARGFVKCSNCGAICGIGLAFNRFLCDECGNVEYCDADELKTIMGDEYISIDEQELTATLKQIE